MSIKSPHPTDKHVGSRIRLRRNLLSMSQEKLGNALGLTFQQVQKYEKGTNRVGASRLQQIAKIMEVPIAYFYEGLEKTGTGGDARQEALDAFMMTRDGLSIALNFLDIPDAKLRGHIADLVATTAQRFRVQEQQPLRRIAS